MLNSLISYSFSSFWKFEKCIQFDSHYSSENEIVRCFSKYLQAISSSDDSNSLKMSLNTNGEIHLEMKQLTFQSEKT